MDLTFENDQQEEILRHIEQYASKSLVQLTLSHVNDHLYTTTKQTFPRVTEFTIISTNLTGNLQLDRIYPRMARLTIKVPTTEMLYSLHRHYKNLIHLKVELGINANNVNLLPILALNPQIKSLALPEFPGPDLLHAINTTLPALETLWVKCSSDGILELYANQQSHVHFANVNTLTIRFRPNSFFPNNRVIPMTFERLEELELETSELREIAIQLIEQNEQLKVLSLPWLETNEIPRLLGVIERLSELDEIRLRWSADVSEADTLRLMEDIGQLTKVVFLEVAANDVEKLKSIVSIEWSWRNGETIFGSTDVTFRRLSSAE